MTSGEMLREEGTAQVLDNEGSSVYRRSAEAVLDELIRSGKPFSVNEVHDGIRHLNVSGHHPNVIGAIFKSASHQGRMRRTGNMVSPNKATSHARPVAEWISVDAVTDTELTDLKRYRNALVQIITLTELAKKTAALPGNQGQDFHAGQLALVRDIDRIVDNS